MEALSIATISIGGISLVGIIMWLLTKIVGRNKGEKLFDIFKKKHIEEEQKEKINKITKEQEIIKKQIEISENSTEEVREKVREKCREAVKEIQKILNEDAITAIDKQIKEDWNDI